MIALLSADYGCAVSLDLARHDAELSHWQSREDAAERYQRQLADEMEEGSVADLMAWMDGDQVAELRGQIEAIAWERVEIERARRSR